MGRGGVQPVLGVEGVRVRFGGLVALDGVSLTVHPGEVVAVIGPNGAGKTTLFNVISGFIRPEAGRVYLEGKDVTGLAPWARARMGVGRTFQQVQLYPGASVLETVAAAACLDVAGGFFSDALAMPWSLQARREAEERAFAALDFFGLAALADQPASSLPAGTARLVELARAVALRPKVLLADEPAAGMEASESEDLARHLEKYARLTGAGVLLVEHDVAMVMGVSDWVYVLDFGRLVAEGPPEQVREDPQVIAAYLGEV